MKKFVEKRYIPILAVIIIAQLILSALLFNFKKQSFHSDELWSYGFAASSEGGYVYANPTHDDYMNYFEWEDCDVLKDYIVVDKSEIFDYKSVYDNCANDLHAPLYFYILHFILSLFCGTWSKWFAFIINAVAFALIQVYLHKLVMLITKDRFFATMCSLYYGFTMGLINMTIYLRTYALGAAFILMFIYYSTRLYYNHENGYWKDIIRSAVFMLLAVLTVNLNLVAAFVVTLLYCVYYLVKKKFVVMFRYGSAMLIAVLLAFGLFPATIKQLFAAGERSTLDGYPPGWQFKIYWAYIQHDIIGFRNSIWPEMTFTYIGVGILVLILITVPLYFVFRKETWLQKAKAGVKKGCSALWEKRKHFQYPIVVAFATVFFVLLADAYVTNISTMIEHSRRYIFIVYAVYACFITTFFYYPVKWIFKQRWGGYALLAAAMCVCMCVVHFDRSEAFFFEYAKDGVHLDELEDNADVMLTLDDAFVLVCATDKLMDKGRFFTTTNSYIMIHGHDEYADESIGKNPMYLALSVGYLEYDEEPKFDEDENGVKKRNEAIAKVYREDMEERGSISGIKLSELKKTFMDTSGAKSLEYVGTDSLFGRRIEIYRVHFE